MIRIRYLALATMAALFACQASPAAAQTKVITTCATNVPGNYPAGSIGQPFTMQPDGTLCVNATVNASVSGFSPSAAGARGTPLTVTTSDSSGTLPTGAVVVVSNVGTTNPMYCNVNAVAATASDQLITANGGWFAFTIPASVTTLRCIATGGSTTANMVGGSGLPTGTGGGGGGSGGGGAITAAINSYAAGAFSAGAAVDGWDLTQGAKADAACGTDTGTCTEIALIKRALQTLTTIAGSVAGDIPSVTGPLNAATAAATKMLVIGCQYLSSLPTYTNTQQGSCTFDVNGRLLVTTLSSSVGVGATGSAPPANAVYLGANSSGATGGLLKGLIQCDSFVPLNNLATATTAELVALTSGRTIYVCGFHIVASGTTTVTLKYGTGSNCGTGTQVITDGYDLTAQTGLVDRSAFWQGMKTASANALCVTNSAAVKITGGVYYTVQ